MTTVSRMILKFLYPPSYFWGTIFISITKSKSSDAVKRLNKETDAITKFKTKILIFPEAERNESDQLLPFKKGPFHIAIESQSMLLPVVVQRYKFLDSIAKRFDSGKT